MDINMKVSEKISDEKIVGILSSIQKTVPVPLGQYRKALKKAMNESITNIQVFQDQPNTCVVLDIAIVNDGEAERFVGFSKVCYPDTFDPQVGIEIARNKAIGKAVKAYLLHLYGYYIQTCLEDAFDLINKVLGEDIEQEQENGTDEPSGEDQA